MNSPILPLIEAGHLMALTLHQPWASLVADSAGSSEHFGKHYETRTWQTNYRGPLAIHAALTEDYIGLASSRPFFEVLRSKELPLGCIVAVAHLVTCTPTNGKWVEELPDHEQAFGDFGPGRFGWLLGHVRKLPEPIEARGYQGLWKPGDETIEAIKDALAVEA